MMCVDMYDMGWGLRWEWLGGWGGAWVPGMPLLYLINEHRSTQAVESTKLPWETWNWK